MDVIESNKPFKVWWHRGRADAVQGRMRGNIPAPYRSAYQHGETCGVLELFRETHKAPSIKTMELGA